MSAVGPYRVLGELGRGGMGRVLLGCGVDGRLVAIKVVHEQFAVDEGFRERFRREVEASRVVSGAYTAAVVDADADARLPWLASVFVPGPSLDEVVGVAGGLPVESVMRLTAGLASALVRIHGAGLVHRDVKPSNVLLADDGPRVIDFGIVRAAGDGADGLTRSGWLVGSPAFMSPEQARGEVVSGASDVFSLGSVVVAACSGVSPFAGGATLETLNRIVGGVADVSGLPREVARVVEPCLAKNPGDRPSAVELVDLIGPIAPSVRPWPADVEELIRLRWGDVARLLDPDTTLLTEDPAGEAGGGARMVRVHTRATNTDNGDNTDNADTGDTDTATKTGLPPTRVEEPSTGTLHDSDSDSTPPPKDTAIVGSGHAPAGRRSLKIALAAVLVIAGVVAWTLRPQSTATTEEPAAALEQTGVLTGPTSVRDGVFSPDGRIIATEYQDETVQFWDVASRKQVGQIIGPVTGLTNVVFTQDNSTVITLTIDGIVQRWDVNTGSRIGEPFEITTGPNWDVSGDGSTIFMQTYSGGTEIWDVASGELTTIVDDGGFAAINHDGSTMLISGSAESSFDEEKNYSTVRLWDVDSQQALGETITLPQDGSYEYLISRDSSRLLTISRAAEGTVLRLWDTASGNQIRQPIDIHVNLDAMEAHSILSPDDRTIMTIERSEVRLWDAENGRELGSIDADHARTDESEEDEDSEIHSARFSPDGKTLATANDDHTLRLWKIPER
ncbi:WD40 repeat domain-containing serine/threonine protein kinase [Prauserella marina]|uniref:WD40 repeat domain-containing serine/threonine protein kinase n=1 Tax=Prauserella marina TaxID=530584 RepID=UPI00115FC2A0|nr:protein kinase [Prauserella marina]